MSGATLSHYAQYYGIRGSAAALRRLSFERAGAIAITRNGYLRLAHDDGDVEAFARSVEIQRSLGVMDARVVDREGLRSLVPKRMTAVSMTFRTCAVANHKTKGAGRASGPLADALGRA